MIISRTPLRISFAGGGSDLAAFYRHEPGAVVSTAIDKYIYITVNRKFDGQIRASYAVTEIVDRPEQLRHELIREAFGLAGVPGGIEITSISDIPSQGTGLGSSSTYTVGLLNALHAYRGRHAGAERLARESCAIEIEHLGSRSASRTSTSPPTGACNTSSSTPTRASSSIRSSAAMRRRHVCKSTCCSSTPD
jgi:D-glycero-alpha-D-manno-heptose-7-phosphate kinase